MTEKGNRIDLHAHTSFSDGRLTPEELIAKAAKYGLSAISITDHDTIEAYSPRMLALAESLGIEIVPGIELSTRSVQGKKYHILGYFIDVENSELREELQKIREQRKETAKQIIDKFLADGWNFDTSLLETTSPITKAHLARFIIQDERNTPRLIAMFSHIPQEGEFIEATMIHDTPYFLEQESTITPEKAIEMIHKAGGVAILAHPAFNVMKGENAEELALMFLEYGIDGFEAISVQFDRSNKDQEFEHRDFFTKFCEEHNLIITGGSDYHTDDESQIGRYIDLGFLNHDWALYYGIVEALKNYKETQDVVTLDQNLLEQKSTD